jgi:hypothetical protein
MLLLFSFEGSLLIFALWTRTEKSVVAGFCLKPVIVVLDEECEQQVPQAYFRTLRTSAESNDEV